MVLHRIHFLSKKKSIIIATWINKKKIAIFVGEMYIIWCKVQAREHKMQCKCISSKPSAVINVPSPCLTGNVELLGGWNDANPEREDVQEAAKEAVEAFNMKSRAKKYFKLINITSARTQVQISYLYTVHVYIMCSNQHWITVSERVCAGNKCDKLQNRGHYWKDKMPQIGWCKYWGLWNGKKGNFFFLFYICTSFLVDCCQCNKNVRYCTCLIFLLFF